MAVTSGVFVYQWLQPSWNIWLWLFFLYLSVAVTTIAHNHNHLPVFKNKWLNVCMDYWLTVFYGFPAFAWIPTHNMNHHVLNNKEGDYTLTYRITEQNHLLMLLLYPAMSSYFQQTPIRNYLGKLWRGDRSKFCLAFGQYIFLAAWAITFFIIDWQKAILYVLIPTQVGLFSVLVFNWLQHVHADEESEYNHSRNFLGFTNPLLFNNGYHTIHHLRAGSHWSETPAKHKEIEHLIDPVLIERSLFWYLLRVYVLAPFVRKYRSQSMRLARIRRKTVQV
jgi:fatty acid desaturase